ncbi:ATP-dependent protease ATP-binding subunit HslU [Staphylococcus gallinarum]|uniref:ATP-dependent protease ATP-binding subunit HslU n=1 Tax=Staphylococcus gallinarum TaxID=1293 RepID=A0A380FEV0_STAGA|nr:ATP-dependent protease ATP-binding subunit HslU [Staphylococcus gallinarum]
MDTNGIKLTPKDIVSSLNEYIVGQEDAKRKVAVALRNRYRRSLLSEEEKQEIAPKKYFNDWSNRCWEDRNC